MAALPTPSPFGIIGIAIEGDGHVGDDSRFVIKDEVDHRSQHALRVIARIGTRKMIEKPASCPEVPSPCRSPGSDKKENHR